MTDSAAAIIAQGLGLRTQAGWVFRDVDLLSRSGDLTLVTGPARSGKTALLLTLAGRMRVGHGELSVAGLDARLHRGPVRRLVGLGEFRGVNELDETLTVHDVVLAELALHGRHWRHACIAPVLAPLGVELEPRAKVRELDATDRLLLGAALGLVGRPQILVLDEMDEEATPEEALVVVSALRRLTAAGVTVVAGALDPALAAFADAALALNGDGSPDCRSDALLVGGQAALEIEPVTEKGGVHALL